MKVTYIYIYTVSGEGKPKSDGFKVYRTPNCSVTTPFVVKTSRLNRRVLSMVRKMFPLFPTSHTL